MSASSLQVDRSYGGGGGTSSSSLRGMERQSVRELRKAAQDAAADPLHSYGYHAAQRLAEEPWEDDGGGLVDAVAASSGPPLSTASMEPRTVRAPPTRIHHPPRSVAEPGAASAKRADVADAAPPDPDAGRADPDASGAALAAEVCFLREENTRLLERTALLEEMAAKAWSDHSAEAVSHGPARASAFSTPPAASPRGSHAEAAMPAAEGVLDAIDNTPPTSPAAVPLSAGRARRSAAGGLSSQGAVQAGQGASGTHAGALSSPSTPSDRGPASRLPPGTTEAEAPATPEAEAPAAMVVSTPIVPNAFSLASGSPFDKKPLKKPAPPPRVVRVRLGAAPAAPRSLVRLRMSAAESGPHPDDDDDDGGGAEADAAAGAGREMEAMRMELERLRGQLAAAAGGARHTSESTDAEIAALKADMEQVKQQLQRSRVERTRCGLALEKAAERNRKAMLTPVQIYTVFLLGYTKGRMKTEQDLQQQHEDLQMLLRETDE